MLRLLAFLLFMGNFSLMVNGMPLVEEETAFSRVKRQTMQSLLRKTYDFSETCPGGIVLKVQDTQINRRDLRLSAADAVS